MTTNSVPPKIEAINLPNPIPYTYDYNFSLLNAGSSSSLFYDLYLSDSYSSKGFTYAIVGILVGAGAILYFLSVLEKTPGSDVSNKFSLGLSTPKLRKRKESKNV